MIRKDGTLLGVDSIEKAFWDIVADAKKGDGAGVGVLSSDDKGSGLGRLSPLEASSSPFH